jgi:esterase/lipase superfamily enzyme
MQKCHILVLHLAIAVCLILPLASSAQAQPKEGVQPALTADAQPDLAALNRRLEDLRKAGKFEKALPIAREALTVTIAREGRDALATARALTVVAELYFELKNYAEAEPLFRRALQIRQAANADPSEIAIARANLDKVHEAQEERRAAAEAKNKALLADRSVPEPKRRQRQLRGSTRNLDQDKPIDWDVVPVFYGTDRKQKSKADAKPLTYSEERAQRLELGRALVTVPKNHQVPQIERPWALHIPYFDVTLYEQAEDPKEHFTVQEVKALSRPEFLTLVRERLATSNRFKDNAFVFIHGYNTSFEYGLYRTAQIANDLQFDGAPFMYSWPSGGAVTTYGWDRESAEGARDYLRQFLDMVIKESGAESISLIAHSMGNIALMDVLRDMSNVKPKEVVINQIIFAAPDVSVDDFAKLAKSIKGLVNGATLYASSNDRALQISRSIWRSYRAGDVPPMGPLLADGVDTIDVTAASMDLFDLNHSGYAQNNDLLRDVGALIETGLRPPQSRSLKIRAVSSPKGEYWRYVP